MNPKLKNIEQAQRLTEQVFQEIIPRLNPGVSEQAIVSFIRRRLKTLGSASAFPPIAAFGRSTANVHHVPSARRLKRGDLIMLDFGAMSEGYRSDMTRMLSLGAPGGEAKRVFDITRRAQSAVIKAIRPGARGNELHQIAERTIARAGYGSYAMRGWYRGRKARFGLGHGIGKKIHQNPKLTPRHTAALKPGDVVTVEPGIYLPGRFGVRVEDMVLVTPRGNRVLTRTPRTLRVL